jgi:hypothetical protein
VSEELRQQWLELTRVAIPARAASESWPLRSDHCFQRVILDAVCGGRWYDHVAGRPAYRHLPPPQLERAVAMAQQLAHGEGARSLLVDLNRQSLRWRGKYASS